MTYFLFIMTVFIWPFGQLLNIQLPALSLVIYPLDLVCSLLTLSLLFSKQKRQQILHDPLFKPLAIFLIMASVSLLVNLKFAISGGLLMALSYLLRLFIYPSVYFAAKQTSLRKDLRPIIFSLGIFSLLGLLQYIFLPDMRWLKNLGFDDHYFRLIGSFYDPNFTGAILAATALACLALSQWLPALLMVLLLALTFSRASYLVFLLGLIYLCLLSFSRKRGSIWAVFFYLVVLVSLIILIPKPSGEGVNLWRTFSILSRFDSWQAGWALFLQKPLFGWGYNTLRGLNGQRFQIDNSYLYLAATTGFFGLLAFLNLLKHAIKNISFFPLKIFLLALLTHSIFNNSLFYIWLYFAFWLALGLRTKEYIKS